MDSYSIWRNKTLLLIGGGAASKLELTFGDLDIIKCNSDSVEDCAAAMLNKWLTSGKATKQALVEALQMVK